jgi:hypothetical protein
MTSQFLSIKKLTGKSIILVAAKHNHREIIAEYGAGKNSHIDLSRIPDNILLRGLETAAGVAAMAQSLMKNAGVKSVRKDAVRALEIIFSLPPESAINHEDFFKQSVEWAEDYFQAPIISAIIHNDEAAPHCHVLLLPLVAGRMNGSAMLGGKAKLTAMQINFHECVGERHGLQRHVSKPHASAAKREEAAAQLFAQILANPSLLSQTGIAEQLIKAIAHDPAPLNLAMGSRLESVQKPDTLCATIPAPCGHKNPIGFDDATPVEFEPVAQAGNHQSLSCVGIEPRPALAKANAGTLRADLQDAAPAAFNVDQSPGPATGKPDAAPASAPACAPAPAPAKAKAKAKAKAGTLRAGLKDEAPAAFKIAPSPGPTTDKPNAPALPRPAPAPAKANASGLLAGLMDQASAFCNVGPLLRPKPAPVNAPAPASAPAPSPSEGPCFGIANGFELNCGNVK